MTVLNTQKAQQKASNNISVQMQCLAPTTHPQDGVGLDGWGIVTGKPSYTENDGLQKCLCRSVSPHCENVLKIFLIFFFMQFRSFWRQRESFRFQTRMQVPGLYRNTAASSFRKVKINQANTEIPSNSQLFYWIFFHHFPSDLEIHLIPFLILLGLIVFWFDIWQM